jgi:hypothetical protein
MSIGVFVDKASPPTMDQVVQVIGARRSAWEELVRFMHERFSPHEELKFYGKNYGWAMRFRKGGKAIASLYPADQGFTIQIILGSAETRKARAVRLGKHVQRIIDEAHAYPEGRWLFIPVKSAKDIKDVEQLLALKFRAPRPRE